MPPGPQTAREPERDAVARADRRWFLTSVVVFGVSVGGLFGARALYHLTGPHPEVTLFLRHLRRMARWLIPRQGRVPKHWW